MRSCAISTPVGWLVGFLNSTIQNLPNGSHQNSVGGLGIHQGRTHNVLVLVQIKGWIGETGLFPHFCKFLCKISENSDTCRRWASVSGSKQKSGFFLEYVFSLALVEVLTAIYCHLHTDFQHFCSFIENLRCYQG